MSRLETRHTKRHGLIEALRSRFPDTPVGLQVFFTDPFDVGKYYDATSTDIIRLVELAQKKRHVDTRFFHICSSLNWRDLKEDIADAYDELLNSEVIRGLGASEKMQFLD